MCVACAELNNTRELAPAPFIPAVPVDLESCQAQLSDGPDVALNAGQVAHDWGWDRSEAVKVNACQRRLACWAHDVRKKVGKVKGESTCPEIKAKRQSP